MLAVIEIITQWLLPISALLAVIAVIIENSEKIAAKPVSAFFSWLSRKMNSDKDEKLDEMKSVMIKYLETSSQKDEELQQAIDDLKKDMGDLRKNMDDNERDRIRAEIFRFGRLARLGSKITTEEWRHIQDIYYKYHDTLLGNGSITEEYSVIKGFYEDQFKKRS